MIRRPKRNGIRIGFRESEGLMGLMGLMGVVVFSVLLVVSVWVV